MIKGFLKSAHGSKASSGIAVGATLLFAMPAHGERDIPVRTDVSVSGDWLSYSVRNPNYPDSKQNWWVTEEVSNQNTDMTFYVGASNKCRPRASITVRNLDIPESDRFLTVGHPTATKAIVDGREILKLETVSDLDDGYTITLYTEGVDTLIDPM